MLALYSGGGIGHKAFGTHLQQFRQDYEAAFGTGPADDDYEEAVVPSQEQPDADSDGNALESDDDGRSVSSEDDELCDSAVESLGCWDEIIGICKTLLQVQYLH